MTYVGTLDIRELSAGILIVSWVAGQTYEESQTVLPRVVPATESHGNHLDGLLELLLVDFGAGFKVEA